MPSFSYLVAALTLCSTAPDLSSLTEAQRDTFRSVATEEFCNCGSPMTIAGCLDLKPNCPMAHHLSQVIVRGIAAGNSSDELLGFLSSRVVGPLCGAATPIDVSQAPGKGPPDAPITLIEFADFRCSHCQRAAPIVHQALKRYQGKVRFYFMPFPLQNNPLSVAAAEAFLAAHDQGKGWLMLDALFANGGGDFHAKELSGLARQVGLDLSRFEKAMQAHQFRQTVMHLKAMGEQAGVQGTPAFFVNGRPFHDDEGLFTFADRFEMELDRAHQGCQ